MLIELILSGKAKLSMASCLNDNSLKALMYKLINSIQEAIENDLLKHTSILTHKLSQSAFLSLVCSGGIICVILT